MVESCAAESDTVCECALVVDVVYVIPPAGGDERSLAATQTVCVWLSATVDVSSIPLQPPGCVGFVEVDGVLLFEFEHAVARIGVRAKVTVVPTAWLKNSRRLSMVFSSKPPMHARRKPPASATSSLRTTCARSRFEARASAT
jgi:hypothetical protein